MLPFMECLAAMLQLRNLEHSIFPVYFALSYLYFNWWLYSKIHIWIYFFLDYDRLDLGQEVNITYCK